VGELEKLLTRHDDKLQARIVAFCRYDVGAPAQPRTQLKGIPTTLDLTGAEARRFHVATSGQVLLYDAAGALQFSGGITVGRGHAGDSDGSDSINAVLRGDTPAVRRTPVYGCSIARPLSVTSPQP